MWVMWCYCDCSWMRSTVVIQSRSSQGAVEMMMMPFICFLESQLLRLLPLTNVSLTDGLDRHAAPESLPVRRGSGGTDTD
jgi:hypothetical protein